MGNPLMNALLYVNRRHYRSKGLSLWLAAGFKIIPYSDFLDSY